MSHDESTAEGDPILDPTADVTDLGTEPLSFTRGMNPRSAVAWVREKHGEAGVRSLRAALPRDVVTDLGSDLRPPTMAWVPFLTHARLLDTIVVTFGEDRFRTAREVGRFMAHHDLPGVARPMAMLLSPGFLVDMSVKIWRLYNSHGHWELVRGRREITASLFDRPETHPTFCVALLGWIEGALITCGAVDALAVEERCRARGAPCCSFRVRWSEASDAVRDRTPRPPS